MAATGTVGNKKVFTADPVTGKLLIDLDDLNAISDFTVTFSGVPQWTNVTKTYSDFSAAATTKDIEIFSLPAGGVIHGVKIKHSTAFSGGSLTSYTVSVGLAGDLDKYASAFDVFQAASDTTFQMSQNFVSENHGAVSSVRAEATGSHNLDTATAGSVTFWIYYSEAV